jgi:anti-sigma B factor antagonist
MHTSIIANVGSIPDSNLGYAKESSLSLSLESSRLGDAIVLHCKGRIVFRQEVIKLSQVAGDSIESAGLVILDLKGVSAIDSAGLGEMVSLHMWAKGHGCALKMTGLSSRIRHLLELTNLTSVFEIYATEEEALATVA